jgi:hypothetical protein
MWHWAELHPGLFTILVLAALLTVASIVSEISKVARR